MRIVDVRQRTPEWHAWRKQGIGATMAAPILRKHPEKTPWRLWAELVGKAQAPDLSKIPQVRLAIYLEPYALQWFQQEYGGECLPVCGEHEEFPIIRCSFDGLLETNEPVEVKIHADPIFFDVRDNGTASAYYQLHWWQVQHQLLVSGAKRGYLLFYHTRERPLVFEIVRDETVHQTLVVEELGFWNLYLNAKEPVKDPKLDFFQPEGNALQEWILAADKIRRLERVRERMESRLNKVKALRTEQQTELVALMGGFMLAEAHGVRVTRFNQNGKVDWNSLVQDNYPDITKDIIDRYRDRTVERSRIIIDPDTPLSSASIQVLMAQTAVDSDLDNEAFCL
jgi:putative phage-type endonuclease